MKKIIKMTIAIVLVVSMAFVTFGYSIDQIMKTKNTLRNYAMDKHELLITPNELNIDKLIATTDVPDAFSNYESLVKFGNYPQTGASDMSSDPIEWIILDKSDTKALLISKYILLYQPLSELPWEVYPSKEERKEFSNNLTYSWDSCSLRKYLNSTFLNKAFQGYEQDMILTNTTTNDKVFIMDSNEAKAYFNLNDLNYKWGNGWGGALDLNAIYKYKGNPWTITQSTNFAKLERKKFQDERKQKWGNNKEFSDFGSQIFRDCQILQIDKGYSQSENVYFDMKKTEEWWGDSSNIFANDLKLKNGDTRYYTAYGIRPCIWISLDPSVKSAKQEFWEDVGGGLGKNVIGGALDSVLPGSSLLIP